MNASLEWLRAFVNVDLTAAQLRDLLTAHTATVDELVPLRSDLAPIVVGRVTEAARHPDSDHLWVTRVDAGGGGLLEVICGAPNVTAGASYPFAPVGTTMPNGMKIERRKIRGIVSNGMLCSARELGLGDDREGILELTTPAAPGTPLLSVLPIGDTRLLIDVGANRPDLLSHLGIAREISAITGRQWQLPHIEPLGPEVPAAHRVAQQGTAGTIEIAVDPDTKTRRYVAAVIRGVTIRPSPEWLVQRLAGAGVREINNVVDATNYVLHELGQPVHAFDASRLSGPVRVRRSRTGETLVTLDGVRRALPADCIVIADSGSVQAVAGVMGGRESEVTEGTRDILVEVASFDPKLTRAARRALGMSTDASYRFERGVDPDVGPMALERVVRIITSLAGGALDGTPLDVGGPAPARPEIRLRAARIAQVLGVGLPIADARAYLARAGFDVAAGDDRETRVRAPSWRQDVSGEIDLIEDVARFHGYDAFPNEIRPFRPTTTVDDPLWTIAGQLRELLVGLGLLETRPMPFVHARDDSHVRVANPLSENEAFLRTSLLETLARLAEFNLAQRSGDVRIFEIGSAFHPTGAAMPREELRVAAVIMGRRRPSHFTEPQPPLFDEWDAKNIAESIAEVAYGKGVELVSADEATLWRIHAGNRPVGAVSRLTLDAPVWAAPAFGIEMLVSQVETAAPAHHGAHTYIEGKGLSTTVVSQYRPLPAMPPAEFDLALLVPSRVAAADVERVIRAAAGDLLEHLELFDLYTGTGVVPEHRSLAWRLTFRHPERTLRDKEIEGRRGKILAALQQELHVSQRTG